MADPVGPDRRKSPRMNVKRLAVLYHPQVNPHDILHNQPPHKGVVADLSESGLKVLVREPIPEGFHLDLALEIPALKQEVSVKGQVTRCVELPSKPGKGGVPQQTSYEIGVSLSGVHADYRELLDHLRANPLLRAGGI